MNVPYRNVSRPHSFCAVNFILATPLSPAARVPFLSAAGTPRALRFRLPPLEGTDVTCCAGAWPGQRPAVPRRPRPRLDLGTRSRQWPLPFPLPGSVGSFRGALGSSSQKSLPPSSPAPPNLLLNRAESYHL